MKNKKFSEKIKRSLRLIYLKLFRINDTPQRIALGAGLGVFCGIMPGSGPIAAICLALIFRVNRAAALLGSLLTNTWLSFIIFVLAIKTGSFILGVNWQEVHKRCLTVFTKFNWPQLFNLSFFKVILPLIVGYLAIGFILGFAAYLVTLTVIKKSRQRHERKI